MAAVVPAFDAPPELPLLPLHHEPPELQPLLGAAAVALTVVVAFVAAGQHLYQQQQHS